MSHEIFYLTFLASPGSIGNRRTRTYTVSKTEYGDPPLPGGSATLELSFIDKIGVAMENAMEKGIHFLSLISNHSVGDLL